MDLACQEQWRAGCLRLGCPKLQVAVIVMPLRQDWEGCMVPWLRPNNWVSLTHGESAFYLGTSDPCLTRGASLRSMRPTHHLDTGSEMVNPAPVMTLATGIRSANLSAHLRCCINSGGLFCCCQDIVRHNYPGRNPRENRSQKPGYPAPTIRGGNSCI